MLRAAENIFFFAALFTYYLSYFGGLQKIILMKNKRLFLTILILFILAAAGSIFVFSIDKWHIEIDCGKENDIKTEYGEAYDDTAATAALKGRYLLKNGFPAAVTSEGSVDTSKLGSYTITYHASFLFWKGEATKTVHVVDTIPPEIKLVTDPDHYTLPGHPYEEEGYSATDNVDGDLTDEVTSEEKDGNVIYKVSDSSGNETTITRKIFYDDPIPPTLTLKGDREMTIQAGSDYNDPGYTAEDNVDGDLTSKVTVEGSVNTYSAGTYTLTYTVKDNYGNEASDTRTVTVEPVRQADTVNPTGKIVYLTFDDGPGEYTSKLLDILDKYNVKVTFFTVGSGHPDLLKAEADAGHSIGIHSATHDYATIYSSEDAYFADLRKQQETIENATGIHTTLVRFPGGSSNTVSKSYCSGIMTKLTQDLTDMGFQYFDWNVASGDAGETTDTSVVVQNVISGIQQHDVSIVLQHDIKGFSVNGVEQIIQWGLAHGYTFLPLKADSPTAHHGVNN